MNGIFRMGSAHAGDIGAVADYLKKQAAVPVWLVGTSMGTFSAAGGAIVAGNVDGLVLTSTITRAQPHWKIAQSHPRRRGQHAAAESDGADADRFPRQGWLRYHAAGDAPKLRKALANAKPVDVVLLSGGDTPRSDPCEAMAQHGFLGIEGQAVDTIAKFIAANSK